MKKFMSILLAAALTVSLGVTAMAAYSPKYTPVTSATIEKTFRLTENDASSPEETFYFTATALSYKAPNATTASEADIDHMPKIEAAATTFIAGAATTDGAKQDATFNLSNLSFTKPGVYYYTVTETSGSNSSISYNIGQKSYIMALDVVNKLDTNGNLLTPRQFEICSIFFRDTAAPAGDKIGKPGFENQYPAKNLTITKTVAGPYGNPDDEFKISFTIKAPTGQSTGAVTIVGPNDYNKNINAAWTEETVSNLSIKHDQSYVIKNLPVGTTVTVTETDSGNDYVATYTVTGATGWTIGNNTEPEDFGVSGTMPNSGVTVVITNFRDHAPETGISLDSLPYLVLLGGVAVGLAIVFLTKRKRCEDQL